VLTVSSTSTEGPLALARLARRLDDPSVLAFHHHILIGKLRVRDTSRCEANDSAPASFR
jgi:hypothetical protein